MLRTLILSAAIAAISPAAFAQAFYDDANGLSVQGRAPEAYIIVIVTRGKDETTFRREISDAARVACQRAPRTGYSRDFRLDVMQSCVGEATYDAALQLNRIMEQRRYDDRVNVAAF